MNPPEDTEGDALPVKPLEFSESAQLSALIDDLTDASCQSEIDRELGFQEFSKIVDRYQEQPHVIDPHLEGLVGSLLAKGRDPSLSQPLTNQAFTYLYLLVKMRGYKNVIRYMPHEVSDLDPLLVLLEAQDPDDPYTWQTRYSLLLWLSMVIKIPFQLSRFDAGVDGRPPMVDRVLEVGRRFLESHDKSHEASAFLLAHFLTRPDVKGLKLDGFVDWLLLKLPSGPGYFQTIKDSTSALATLHGTLTALALLFKHGQREDLIPLAPRVIRGLLDREIGEFAVSTVRRLVTKTVNRIGLTFLKSRVASWRYSRGSRSLKDNLETNTKARNVTMTTEQDEEENVFVADEVEEIIAFLLEALKDRETIVRWSAAKGVGRVTGRLPRELADQVVASVLELFSPLEGDGAWHGACLTLAELGRRGLLLPSRLPQVVPVVAEALAYEDLRGSYAVGAHVRDAACYVCWSFARAYDPEVIRPHVEKIAGALLVTTVFDREVNCRRAASAAFQENVGRQGEFPHGIEILTAADYFAVGNRTNSFVNIARFVAQFPEYTTTLVEHLVQKKTSHWDPAIRELTGAALASITEVAQEYVATAVLPRLVRACTSLRLEERHGALYALGDVMLALGQFSRRTIGANWKPEHLVEVMTTPIWVEANSIVPTLKAASLFKGLAGEWTKKACCHMIHRLSEARMPLSDLGSVQIKRAWLEVIDDVLPHGDQTVAALGVDALPHVCESYFNPESENFEADCSEIVNRYTEAIYAATLEKSRQGHARALANLPAFMLTSHLSVVVTALRAAATVTPETLSWAEARRDAVSALAKLVTTVGLEEDPAPSKKSFPKALFDDVVAIIMTSLDDYTLDSRGDVGSLVREAGLSALELVFCFAADKAPSFISPSLSATAFASVVQQACEKIDRTRSVAGRAFASLLWHEPPVPHAPRLEDLRAVFPRELCAEIVWSSPSSTFPLFGRLLSTKEFAYPVLLGFVVSVGGLTESLVLHAGEALTAFFHGVADADDEDEFRRVSGALLDVLERNPKNERVAIPFFKMMDHLLASGCLESVVAEERGRNFGQRLVALVRQEVKLSRNPQKLMAATLVLCGCLQFSGEARRKALVQLSVFLCHRFPRVRTITAEKLYEALVAFDDVLDEDDDDSSKLDIAMNILSETQWDSKDVNKEVKPLRNKLCSVLGINPPVPVEKKS